MGTYTIHGYCGVNIDKVIKYKISDQIYWIINVVNLIIWDSK